MKTPIYQRLSGLIGARANCIKSNNNEWFNNHTDKIEQIMDETAPSGSGIDSGTKIILHQGDHNTTAKASTGERLVFLVEFHHMDEHGYYDGWTSHILRVKPSLQFGFDLTFSGPDRNQIKEYLHDLYSFWLTTETEI